MTSSTGSKNDQALIHHRGLSTLCCDICQGLAELDNPTKVKYADVSGGKAHSCSFCTFLVDCIDVFENVRKESEAINDIGIIFWDGLEVTFDNVSVLDLFSPLGTAPLFKKLLPLRDIAGDPLSHTCRNAVQGWIDECVDGHHLCVSTASEKLPKRLVYIGENDDEQPRLVSPTSRIPYAALSHCWGEGNTFCTTTANLASRKFGIPPSQIARTFHDAIQVTRWLGLKHIWIDSLCIVQDDTVDWESEAANMADIYAGSLLAIAASRARDSASGFLGLREETRRVTLTDWRYGTVPVCVRRHIDHDLAPDMSIPLQLSDDRLMSRAWCYQERMLAPRILFFGKQELYLQCRMTDRCECAKAETVFPISVNPPTSRRFTRLALSENPCIGISFGYLWGSVLEEYSSLSLTYEKDRLPALSGLAKFAEAFNPGEYVAGLWEKDLPYQLLWHAEGTTGMGVHMPKIQNRFQSAKEYAPTFSWTAWIEPISYHKEETSPACKVVEIHSTTSQINKYGSARNAYLRLRSQLAALEPIYRRIYLSENTHFNNEADFQNCKTVSAYPALNFDHHYTDSHWSQLFFFKLVICRRPSGYVGSNGLILRETALPGTYTRVGVGTEIPFSWVGHDTPIVTVTVI